MRKCTNQERIEGRLFQHELALRTVQNQSSANYGKKFIAGNIDIATDEEGLNVLTVHFTYVTETTKSGAQNKTFAALQSIMESGVSWVSAGKDTATKLRIDASLALNDFYGQDGALVSQKQNEGSFVTIISELSDEKERNTFTTDMFITSATVMEPEDDEMYMSLRGCVFNYKNDLLPVEFIVRNQAGIEYFEDLEISNSNPVFTKVWGRIVGTTTSIEKTEESAFGEAEVKRYARKIKEWVVTGASKAPYDYGDPTILTADDITAAMQNREVYLADVKRKREEYEANKVVAAMNSKPSGFDSFSMSTPMGADIPSVKKGTFNF